MKDTRTVTPTQAPANSRGGGAPTGASLTLREQVMSAVSLAQTGDATVLQELFASGVDVSAVLGNNFAQFTSTHTEETVAQVHSEPTGAVWADMGKRTTDAEETRVGMGQPDQAEIVAESTAPDVALPPAVEIHDLGPAQRWGSVSAEIGASEEAADSDRVADLLVTDLGTDLHGMNIHLDRPAWRVATTYNAEAVVIEEDVYLHRIVEERIADQLYGPEVGDSETLDATGDRVGGLVEVAWRPPFLRHSGSAVVMTEGGYTIEMNGSQVIIFDETGDQITDIWGDPHVNEGKGGDNWHFGQDSTFILPDGTKICLDTEPNSAGEWYVVGVNVVGGSQRYHYGVGGQQGMTQDAEKWDLEHADAAKDASAGIFALGKGNEWAIQGDDGEFYDIQDETWGQYQQDRDVDYSKAKKAEGVNNKQRGVAGDKDLQAYEARKKRQGGRNGSVVSSHKEEQEDHVWVAAQQVEVDARTGKVIDPLRYFPEAVRIDVRGEPNYIPGIEREMAVSQPHEASDRAGQLLEPHLGMNFSRYDVHLDAEAAKVAWAYNAEAVLLGNSLYVADDIATMIEPELLAPALEGKEESGDTRDGFLIEAKFRPPFAKLAGSTILITPKGYTIEMKGTDLVIFDETGDQLTHIWGDPHVNEGKGGDNWHFGQDSTFILPDGTKICLDTKQVASGEWIIGGVDVLSGQQRYHYGDGGTQGKTEDAEEFDKTHKDAAADGSAGVFALQANGQWAIMAKDGKFYDIKDESWGDYVRDHDVDFDPNSVAVGLTEAQLAVADDRDLAIREAAAQNGWGRSRPVTSGGRRYQRFEEMHLEAELMAILIQEKAIKRRIG